MSILQQVFHNFLIKIIFHAERLKIISAKYPYRFVQKKLDSGGVLFEVHSVGEMNRVRFLDEEETFMRQMLAELNMEDVFFDVGACIGLFSLHAAKRCRHVFAFEPEPGFREHLERNVKINDFQNLTILPYAISDQSGTLSLFTNGTDGKSPSLENNGFQNTVDVEARTLPGLVFQDHILPPTIIKIDIEGAEILAIRGMKELFKINPPRLIFLELHPILLTHFGSSTTEVLSLLAQSGYKIRQKSQRDEQIHYIFEWNRISLE